VKSHVVHAVFVRRVDWKSASHLEWIRNWYVFHRNFTIDIQRKHRACCQRLSIIIVHDNERYRFCSAFDYSSRWYSNMADTINQHWVMSNGYSYGIWYMLTIEAVWLNKRSKCSNSKHHCRLNFVRKRIEHWK
jgi:hypothetical protein